MTDIFGGNGQYLYEDFDFNTHRGINCVDPIDEQDVATKHYIDGRTLETGWYIDGNALTVPGIIGSTNDIDFNIVRNNVSIIKFGSTDTTLLSGSLIMTGGRVTDCADPVNDTDVATKHYVDSTEVGNYVNKAGDTMTGNLNFDGTSGNKKIMINNFQNNTLFMLGVSPSNCS